MDKEDDVIEMAKTRHPEAMAGEFKPLKITWVVGDGFELVVSESLLGIFLSVFFEVGLKIKYLFWKGRKK